MISMPLPLIEKRFHAKENRIGEVIEAATK